MRLLDEQAIELITVGASILAAGGGGDPYIGKLMAQRAIKECGPIRLISVDELHDDDLILSTGMIGAPTVMIEKIPNGQEARKACEIIEQIHGRKVTAIFPIEAGGLNSLLPLATAARLGLPVVDMDGMGRAFPEFQMTTFHLDGVNASPFVVVDEKLNSVLVEADDGLRTERFARAVCARMGGAAIFAGYPITAAIARRSGIHGILSFEQRIGETLEHARSSGTPALGALLDMLQGHVLFRGKVTEVDRRTEEGFSRGVAYFDGIGADKGERFDIAFQNEYLLARNNDRALCITPDLICVLDEETGLPLLAERLRYGARVVAIGIAANPKWMTTKGIDVAGPRYFKYGLDYVPLATLVAGKGALS
ncbi:hypothetical protein ALQ18_01192 [Pseudomonas marginalis pv. marginalis]|nr:hypothetical protein ALQ18_01192 [Pseudomonas marginalis pv. marginalis]